MAFAVPVDAVVSGPGVPVQAGPVALVDPDYEPGFRVGFSRLFDCTTSLGASYTHFESGTRAAAAVDAPLVLQPLVMNPNVVSDRTPVLEAAATYDIDFDRADLEYRMVFSSGCRHEIALLGGACYAGLQQDFDAQFMVNELETVNSTITFDGGGIRLGLEGERRTASCGLLVYGRGTASFVAGDFRASYFHGSAFDPQIVATDWSAGRIVPILDFELGVGWKNSRGTLRLSAGYMVNAWYNTLMTDTWIKAVTDNDFTGLSDTITFDGVVSRAEVRF